MTIKFSVTYEDGQRTAKLFVKDQRALDRAGEILRALRDAGCDAVADDFVREHLSFALVDWAVEQGMHQEQPPRATEARAGKGAGGSSGE